MSGSVDTQAIRQDRTVQISRPEPPPRQDVGKAEEATPRTPTAPARPPLGTTDVVDTTSSQSKLRAIADPLENAAVREGVDPSSPSAREADDATKPSTFRKVLEVAELFGRWLSGWMNGLSAFLSIFRLAFDPPDSGADFAQRMARIGVDLIGVLMPPAAAVGHLALNAWWGADNPSDTELLAGYDVYLGDVPYIGEIAGDQEHQDVWLGAWLRELFGTVGERIRGLSSSEADYVPEAKPGHRDVQPGSSARLSFAG